MDTVTDRNKGETIWKADEFNMMIDGIKKKFARNPKTNDIYDLQSYHDAAEFGGEPVLVGKLVKKEDGKFKFIAV